MSNWARQVESRSKARSVASSKVATSLPPAGPGGTSPEAQPSLIRASHASRPSVRCKHNIDQHQPVHPTTPSSSTPPAFSSRRRSGEMGKVRLYWSKSRMSVDRLPKGGKGLYITGGLIDLILARGEQDADLVRGNTAAVFMYTLTA